MKPLSKRQKELMDYIEMYQIAHRVRPTFIEMSNALTTSISNVQSILYALERKGLKKVKDLFKI